MEPKEKGNTIAVLLIFFNKFSQTAECVESFLPAGIPIYILNNGSPANSWNLLKERFKNSSQIVYINSDRNLGPSMGRNLLMDQCKEDWFFFVDNDVTIKGVEKWKSIWENYRQLYPEGYIFYPEIYNVHEKDYQKPHRFVLKEGIVKLEPTDLEVTNYFTTCGIIINRKIFDLYGPFDPDLFAFEDFELAIRALLSPLGEFKVYHIPQIMLFHNHKFQSSQKDKNAVRERYNEGKIQDSIQKIMDKHGIIFDHEWKWWTSKQVYDMTQNRILNKIKRKVFRIIHRV